jgi:His/Glu/Gln/Arg/opine family amino acid ABC transporter permease subunit
MVGFDPRIVFKYLPLLLHGAWTTLTVSLLGLALATGLSLPIALARMSRARVLRVPSFVYVDLVRGTPLLVQIFAIFYVLPSVGLELTAFQSAVLALGINSGGYQAEILRGGIQAIPRGQVESARSLGMSYVQCLRRIVLPQVALNIMPALTNEISNVIKGSSLVSVLAVVELTRVGQQIVSSILRPVEIYVSVALVYLVMHLVISHASYRVERYFAARR